MNHLPFSNLSEVLNPKSKIIISLSLLVVVAIALWQLASPVIIPSVASKYLYPSQYANRGSWIELDVTSHGKLYVGYSIANLTFPRTYLETKYSLILSKLNETGFPSYIRGFALKITNLRIQDNYDGSNSLWTPSNDITDAAQAISIFYFKTSANHQLTFTFTYSIYEILPVGSLADRSIIRSFNITQNVV